MNSAAKSDLVGKVARAIERAGLGRNRSLRNRSLRDERSGQSVGDLILLALSGGPDSVALLHALRELAPRFGYRLAAAHLNHRLRGAESDCDEMFVREICATLRVELVVEQADNSGVAPGVALDPALGSALSPGAPNLEERARELRYGFLAAAAARLGASRIATAHHADDQAETVMLRLLRGAGAAGLGAMAETVARGPGGLTIVRPMLRVGRAEVLRYLDSIGARFVTDGSNADRGFLRNRVRAELLPALERDFAPGLRRRLAALADEMHELDDYVARAARVELEMRLVERTPGAGRMPGAGSDCFDLNLDSFTRLHPALTAALLREFLARRIGSLRRFTRRHIDGLRRLCAGESPSATLDLPGGWFAERRYAVLALERRSAKADDGRRLAAAEGFGAVDFELPVGFKLPLAPEGVTKVPQAGFVFHSTVMPADAVSMPVSLYEACFDADRADGRLAVRNFVPGDRVFPLGMEGSRKVHDVFVDRKLPRSIRRTFPVVTLEDMVAWIPGMVRGRVALIGAETVRVFRLRAFDDAMRAQTTQ
jgi:tRNA(Ile)-lysidine synthase